MNTYILNGLKFELTKTAQAWINSPRNPEYNSKKPTELPTNDVQDIPVERPSGSRPYGPVERSSGSRLTVRNEIVESTDAVLPAQLKTNGPISVGDAPMRFRDAWQAAKQLESEGKLEQGKNFVFNDAKTGKQQTISYTYKNPTSRIPKIEMDITSPENFTKLTRNIALGISPSKITKIRSTDIPDFTGEENALLSSINDKKWNNNDAWNLAFRQTEAGGLDRNHPTFEQAKAAKYLSLVERGKELQKIKQAVPVVPAPSTPPVNAWISNAATNTMKFLNEIKIPSRKVWTARGLSF